MPFLHKRNTMKKSKLTSKKKKSDKNKRSGSEDPTDDLTGMMHKHNIDDVENVNMEKSSSEKLKKVEEENQYLRLLLGMSHKVDQLYEIWTGHFPTAFSNADTLQTYLELHSKPKQSELIIKTFQHVETIKQFLTDHKSQMLVASASLGENAISVISDDDHSSSDVASSNVSSSQNNQDQVQVPEPQNTRENTSESVMETFSTSKERVDLGRMMSQQV